MNTPLVSVILPMHNARAYLAQCLDSLCAQTLKDFEVLIVDDESTDDSCAFVRAYGEGDPRFRLITQPHQNAGAARNRGFEEARGKYVIFLDADDIFDPALLEKTVAAAEAHRADVVLFGAIHFDHATEEKDGGLLHLHVHALPKAPVFAPSEVADKLFQLADPAPWLRLLRTDFIRQKQLSFQSLPNCNDLYFSYLAMAEAERICAIQEALVFYRVNNPVSLQGEAASRALCLEAALTGLYRELSRRELLPLYHQSFAAYVASALNHHLTRSRSVATRQQLLDFLVSDGFAQMQVLEKAGNFHAQNLQTLKAWLLHRHNQLRPKLLQTLQSPDPAAAPLLSVVVPMYNAGEYLQETLASLKNQSFTDYELLLIDDGSTDDTLTIARELAQGDPRIGLYHQENSGPSVTRNAGITLARGKYLHFMDADDKLEPAAYEDLVARMEAQELELLFFDGDSFLTDPGLTPINYHRSREYAGVHTGPRMLQMMAEGRDYRCSPAMFISRLAFLREHGITFPPGILHEDNLFTFTLLLHARRVSHAPVAYYLRRMRNGSIMTSPRQFANIHGHFVCFREMLKLLQAHESALSDDEYQAFANRQNQMLRTMRKHYDQLSFQQKYCRYGLGRDWILFDSLIPRQPPTPAPVSKRQALAILFPFLAKVKAFLKR